MPQSNLNAAELLRRWNQIVNGNLASGRDGAMLKSKLQIYSSEQILLGMYQKRGNRTISIPQFLADIDDWLEPDMERATIELACEMSGKTPTDYYIWRDMQGEESAQAVKQGDEAYQRLLTWAYQVIS